MTTETDVTGAIERLLRGEYSAVILQVAAGFVQFAEHGKDEFVIEAAGDAVLPERLSPAQLRVLIELGFDPPGRSGSPNHGQYVPRGTPVASLAALALNTMSSVYGAEAGIVELAEV